MGLGGILKGAVKGMLGGTGAVGGAVGAMTGSKNTGVAGGKPMGTATNGMAMNRVAQTAGSMFGGKKRKLSGGGRSFGGGR